MKLAAPVSGKLVTLRSLEVADAERCRAWIADDTVRRFLLVRDVPDLAAEIAWIERVREAPADLVLAIEARDADGALRHVGNTGLHGIDLRDGHAMLGILVGEKSFHNRGIATDAIRTVLRHAFTALGLPKVYARVCAPNLPSLRACEKAGLHVEGVQRRHVGREGERWDQVMLAAFAGEWVEG